ncbi:MAG TPA: bile acid:sodium symporter [Tepidisphaeraceae bacterium]|jgi:BASS family bile acid:Na+ symporter|nr:bile acid:sodium symporter [Tepidisphaeraceae bacterium]
MTIDRWINLLASITLIEMMLTIGLGTKFSQLLAVLQNWRLVLRAILANYVVVPAAAVGLLFLFNARPMVAAGFVIIAVCPGAPYGPPFTSLAKGDVGDAVGLMVTLAGTSAILAPLLLRWLLPYVTQQQDLHVNTTRMVMTLAVSQFLPLIAGLMVCHRAPSVAQKLQKPASRLCSLLNLALLILILWAQYRMLADIRLTGYVGMLMLVAAALLAGWLLSPPGASNRRTLAVTTAVRNVGVALVIASGSFAGTDAVTATTAYGLFQTIAIALIALVWGKRVCSISTRTELTTA